MGTAVFFQCDSHHSLTLFVLENLSVFPSAKKWNKTQPTTGQTSYTFGMNLKFRRFRFQIRERPLLLLILLLMLRPSSDLPASSDGQTFLFLLSRMFFLFNPNFSLFY